MTLLLGTVAALLWTTSGTAFASCHGGIIYGVLAGPGTGSSCGAVATTASGIAFGTLATGALAYAAYSAISAGAAASGTAAEAAAAEAAAAAGGAGGAAPAGGRPNDSRPPKEWYLGGDPVDLASGVMVAATTDVSLDGALALVLKRTHVSSYDAGRIFGPSWSTTLDQRLEHDEQDLVFLNDDAMRLRYPAPTPGSPVLPESGPRWPLHLTADGRYAIAQPDLGRWLHFESGGRIRRLTAISDLAGHRIDFHTDRSGLPQEVRHSGGYRIAVLSENGLVTELRLPRGDGGHTTLVRYAYDEHRRLTEVTDSSGRALRYTYDHHGRITGWTDRNGNWYGYVYDESGRVVRTEGTDGALSAAFSYGEQVTVQTDSLGLRTTFRFNGAGRLVREIDPLGGTTVLEWDADDRLLSRTDQVGRTTTYGYDDDGNPVLVTRPDGSSLRAAYNQFRMPTMIVEPSGATWTYAYDGYGNTVATTDPSGAVTRCAYDERGHLRSVTDALGGVHTVETDAAGLTVAVTDPRGATVRIERDEFGRIVTVTEPARSQTRLSWSVEGRLLSRTLPDGTSERWSYDDEGNQVEHIDPSGNTTRTEYGPFGKPSAVIAPDGDRQEFRYDTELRLTSVTGPQGRVWRYRYDPAGRLVQQTDFDDRNLTYTYDAAGQLTSRTNALRQTTHYRYDALGHVVAKSADGQVTTYQRDPAGRLLQARSPDATLVQHRDPLGRIIAETCNGRTVAFGHDQLGRRSHRTTPTGATSTFAYDAAGNRTALTTSGRQLTFAYDAAGRETARHIGENATLAHTWDAVGRLTTQELTTRTGTLRSRAYAYRADGHLTAVTDQRGHRRGFDLDPVGRVTAVHARDWTESYAYDQAGNQTHATWPTVHPGAEAVGARSYTGTLITRAGGVRYEHDAQGRVTLRQQTRPPHGAKTWRYTWDAEDRLTLVTTPDGTVWHYRYDPLGRRIAKQRLAPGTTTVVEETLFAWDGPTLIEQTTGPVTLTWDHHGLHPVTQTERVTDAGGQQRVDERFHAVVTDLIGTPSELADESGAITWRTRTTVWGLVSWPTRSTAYTPLRFPGQYFDAESGLHYNLHRYYDPETARYLTSDPLGLAASPHPTAYVHNPHTWADPLGLLPDLGFVTVYRKQTEHPLSQRVFIDELGNVTIRGNAMLYLNMSGLISHTLGYRGQGGQITSFGIPTSFRDYIRRIAMPQAKPNDLALTRAEWRDLKRICPEISDPGRSPDLYGLPKPIINELLEEIIPGSGREIQGLSGCAG